MAAAAVENGFLDGRVRVLQPRSGYRAATDPVLMAAAVPVRPGAHVLDLGCGVGVAALCLAARVPDLVLAGLEFQPDYAALARESAALNGIEMAVHEGDVRAMPDALKAQGFDAVMTNPPWFDAPSHASPDRARDRANRLDMDLGTWLGAGLARLRPAGWLVAIHRARALPEILGALAGRAGDIAVLPLAARAGRDAKRVIVKARKGSGGPFRLAAPLVLHEGETHLADGDDFSARAREVLRDGAALDF